MKRLSIIISVFISFVSFSQDAVFYNSNQSLISLNPSFAGTNGLVRNQFMFRDQWPSLGYNLHTFYNSFDAYIKPMHGGLAFSYVSEEQWNGIMQNEVLNLTYAQHFSLYDKKLKIIPSIQVGYFSKTVDYDRLYFNLDSIWWNGGIVEAPSGKIAKQNVDLSSGLLINYNHFYAGVSVFHLTQADQGTFGVNKLPYRICINTSYNFHLNEKNLLRFYARSNRQQNFTDLNIGMDAVLFKTLIMGVGYRNEESIFINLGYRNNYFTIQCGYDKPLSKLAGNSIGSWELSASFNLRNKDLRKTLVDFEQW